MLRTAVQTLGGGAMSANAKSKLCFVIGPVGEEESDARIHADWLLELIIEPVFDEAHFPEFRVERADKLPEPGLIGTQIIDRLLNAELVIADLSFLNPNVFYEIGIRHMVQQPIIHMQLSDQKLPFDVNSYRSIKFSRKKPRDLTEARDALRAQVAAVLHPAYQVENPVTYTRGRIILEQRATDQERVLLGQLQGIQERLDALEANTTRYPNTLLSFLASNPPPPPSLLDEAFYKYSPPDITDAAARRLAAAIKDGPLEPKKRKKES
jgi:hypothetical protein